MEMSEEKLPDLKALLNDKQPPPGISFCTTDRPVNSRGVAGNIQFVTSMKRVKWSARQSRTDWNAKCVPHPPPSIARLHTHQLGAGVGRLDNMIQGAYAVLGAVVSVGATNATLRREHGATWG